MNLQCNLNVEIKWKTKEETVWNTSQGTGRSRPSLWLGFWGRLGAEGIGRSLRLPSAPLGRSKSSCSNDYGLDSLAKHSLLYPKQERTRQLMEVKKSPRCIFAVCNLKVTSVLLLVLEEAQARMGLGMEDIHWENFCQRDRGWIGEARWAVRPDCR